VIYFISFFVALMIPSSLVLYQDHSPVAYRQYSYRDFVKFYPWAEANGLAPPIPPPQINMVITPYNAVYPSSDALFPNVNYASVLTLPYLQFQLAKGDWAFIFSFSAPSEDLVIEFTITATSAFFHLFLVRVSDPSAPWICGYFLDNDTPVLIPYPHNVNLISFTLVGPTQESVPVVQFPYPSVSHRVVQFPPSMSEYITGGCFSGSESHITRLQVPIFYRFRDDQDFILSLCAVPWLWPAKAPFVVLWQFDCSVSLYFPYVPPPSSDSDTSAVPSS
jgi:hypothetical protein